MTVDTALVLGLVGQAYVFAYLSTLISKDVEKEVKLKTIYVLASLISLFVAFFLGTQFLYDSDPELSNVLNPFFWVYFLVFTLLIVYTLFSFLKVLNEKIKDTLKENKGV